MGCETGWTEKGGREGNEKGRKRECVIGWVVLYNGMERERAQKEVRKSALLSKNEGAGGRSS